MTIGEIIAGVVALLGGAVGVKFWDFLGGRTTASVAAVQTLKLSVDSLSKRVEVLEARLDLKSQEKHAESNRANAAETTLYVAEASGCGQAGGHCSVAKDWVAARRLLKEQAKIPAAAVPPPSTS